METLCPGISSVDLEVIPLTDLRRDSRKIIVSISIANKLSTIENEMWNEFFLLV